MRLALTLAAASCIASPAAAQLRPVADQPASEAAAQGGVDVLFVNDGTLPADPRAPDSLDVTASDGSRLRLVRDDTAASPVPPGGFARLRYRPVAVAQVTPTDEPEAAASRETPILASTGTASAILDRFSPYRPTYGAFGLGDSAAKLQVSFAFQPFATNGALDGLRFAWTQTMFWRLDIESGPIRSTNYSPEVFYEVPLTPDTIGAVGYAHDSNGRGVNGSIDVNRIYARLAHRFDLGDRWSAEIAPQAWFYVGRQGAAPDLDRYWGYGSLGLTVAQTDGVKLALTARGNPGTGKGAGEVFASYPMARLGGGLGIYLFGQGFTGFGETIDGYFVRDTHARIGIALTR